CHYTPDDGRNYTVIGTEGRIENFGDSSVPGNHARIHLWNTRASQYRRDGDEVFDIPCSEGAFGGADSLMIEDFIRFLRTGERSGATPLEARMAVAAGYLGAESLRSGSMPFDVPPLP